MLGLSRNSEEGGGEEDFDSEVGLRCRRLWFECLCYGI